MKNEVYGNLNVTISMPVSSRNERLAILEANYKVSELTIDEVKIVFINYKTGQVHIVDVHDWNIDWERFFRENEVV